MLFDLFRFPVVDVGKGVARAAFRPKEFVLA
jgi:hypothetical protein